MNKDKAAKEIHRLVDQLATEDGDESQLRVQLYKLQGSFEVLEECREIIGVEDGASLTDKLRKLKRDCGEWKAAAEGLAAAYGPHVAKPKCYWVDGGPGYWKTTCGQYFRIEARRDRFCGFCGGVIETIFP